MNLEKFSHSLHIPGSCFLRKKGIPPQKNSHSNFFSNVGDFIGPFNLVFHSHSKNIFFFEIGPILTFLSGILNGTIFLLLLSIL